MTHLSLFSGIGGIDLAAHWAGFTTVQFVEKDPYCQRVLAKHWPGVPIHDDIKTFEASKFRGIALVSGGFPCQDISSTGKGKGIVGGDRSALWFDMLRVVRECRPLFVLGENVGALRTRGIDRVLYGLEQAGYTAEPFVVGAGSAGAPHLRRRCFIVAADTDYLRKLQPGRLKPSVGRRIDGSASQGDLAPDSDSQQRNEEPSSLQPVGGSGQVGASHRPYTPWGVCEPPVPGVVARVPLSVDQLRALGNAVVPQQVYPILAAIAEQVRAA